MIATEFFLSKKSLEFEYQTIKCFNLYFLKVRTKPYSGKKIHFHHSQEVTEVTALRWPWATETFQTAHAHPQTTAFHSWWKLSCLLERSGLLDLPLTEFWTEHSMDKPIHSGRDCYWPDVKDYSSRSNSIKHQTERPREWQIADRTPKHNICPAHSTLSLSNREKQARYPRTPVTRSQISANWDVAWVVSQEQLNWVMQDLIQKSHLPGALLTYNNNLAENRTKNSLYQQQGEI